YAVVKGTYLFRNTNEQLDFKMGYPINGIYSGGSVDLNQVQIDQLNPFKIKANDNWLTLVGQRNGEYGNLSSFGNNWKVWQMDFLPEETKTVQVYFIVNTNNATVSKGYNSERKNAFIYLLESGSVWKCPIEKGSFYVQLMDGLTAEHVQGISTGFGFEFNPAQRIFAGMKANFSPTPKDNLVVTYYEHNETLLFETLITQADRLFAKIDELSLLPLANFAYTEVEIGDPYAVGSTFWGALPALLTLFVVSSPFLIGVIMVGIAIWAFAKWMKIRRRKNKVTEW